MRSDVVGMSGHSVVIGRDQDIRADLLQELLDSSHDVGSGAAAGKPGTLLTQGPATSPAAAGGYQWRPATWPRGVT